MDYKLHLFFVHVISFFLQKKNGCIAVYVFNSTSFATDMDTMETEL